MTVNAVYFVKMNLNGPNLTITVAEGIWHNWGKFSSTVDVKYRNKLDLNNDTYYPHIL